MTDENAARVVTPGGVAIITVGTGGDRVDPSAGHPTATVEHATATVDWGGAA